MLSLRLAALATSTVSLGPSHGSGAQASPNVFGSVAIAMRHERYGARWHRAVQQSRSPQLLGLVRQARSLKGEDQASFVNVTINRNISYRFDRGDQWSTADETLARRAGDCEDIVIAKMQALRLLGVPASNLYMTVGRDGAAFHALLLVRIANRFLALDNRTDRLVGHEHFKDFHPILTFSGESMWLHGYRVRPKVRQVQFAFNDQDLPIGNDPRSAPRHSRGRQFSSAR